MIIFMKKTLPSVTLIWIYHGKNATTRRLEIEAFDYPHLTVVSASADVPADSDLCIFWVDDDKPVTKNFIREMTHPLIAGEDFGAVMHFWAGNAISLAKKNLDTTALATDGGNFQSLLKLLIAVLDVSDTGPTGRLHLAFSSSERLAPLTMEAVGFPS